jgi:hypothetical protein
MEGPLKNRIWILYRTAETIVICVKERNFPLAGTSLFIIKIRRTVSRGRGRGGEGIDIYQGKKTLAVQTLEGGQGGGNHSWLIYSSQSSNPGTVPLRNVVI